MNERFVIAVFVERIELQIAVQKQRIAGLAFCDDDSLIWRAFCVNDVVDEQTRPRRVSSVYRL